MVIAGDIGGTKSNLALFTGSPQEPRLVTERTLQSGAFASLEELVQEFLASAGDDVNSRDVRCGCFGVACAVVGDGCKTAPNLPWDVSARAIMKTSGIETVRLINDLEATGFGVPLLGESECVTLQEGSPNAQGNGALIAAGTGLGEAFLYRQGEEVSPVASEGGHTDFAPRNDLEMELLSYLLRHFSHVSYERVVSGPGLVNIYRFLRDSGYQEEPAWLAEKLKECDAAATISALGLTGESELCVRALDVFVSVYGAEAGNLALKVKALGGLYVGGGIAPKIIDKLGDGTFLEAFRDKGRQAPLMATIPVRVILNPKTALLGAARYALALVT